MVWLKSNFQDTVISHKTQVITCSDAGLCNFGSFSTRIEDSSLIPCSSSKYIITIDRTEIALYF